MDHATGMASGAKHSNFLFSYLGQRLASIGDYCTTSVAVANDGLDNDCDGQIDEELANGIDDDGDGFIG